MPMTILHLQCRRRSCTTSQSLSLTSVFPSRYIMVIIIFDIVGRRQRSPSNPPSLPKANFHRFLLCAGLLFYFVSPEVIPLSHKNANLSSCSFVYLSGVFGGHCTHDGRSLLPRPTHRSLLTVHTHILFCPFPCFPPSSIVWLAAFVSILLRLEFVCTSFHHTYASLPTLSTSHPSLRISIYLAGVSLGLAV